MAQLNIDKLLKEYGLTQKDLADCTGINKNTVSKYCNGTFENINKTHIDILCKFFDCTMDELFEIDDSVEVKNPNTIIYDNEIDKFELSNKSIKELKIILNNYNNAKSDYPFNYGYVDYNNNNNNNSSTKLYKKNTAIQGIGQAVFQSNYKKWMNTFVQIPNENNLTGIKSSNKYCNKTRKVLEQQAQRLDLEHDFELNVSTLLDKLISTIDPMIQERYKELIETYNDSKNFPLSFKLTSLYRVIYRILSVQSDSGFRDFITKLRNIYIDGDLIQLTDEELKELYDISKYYLDLLEYTVKD